MVMMLMMMVADIRSEPLANDAGELGGEASQTVRARLHKQCYFC